MTLRPAIYRDVLLRPSETFIAMQSQATPDANPLYVGMRYDLAGSHLMGSSDRVVLEDLTSARLIWQEAMRISGRMHPRWLQAIKEQAPDLLHAHFGVDAAWALPVVRALDIPMVTTFHGWDLTLCVNRRREGGWHHGQYLRRRKQVIERSEVCIAVSDYSAGLLERAGCPPDRIEVIYTGVDTDLFAHAPPSQEGLILFVGRLEPIKGPGDLLQAFRKVRSAHPDATLAVIGDGSLRAQLLELGAEIGGVTFLGSQPPMVVGEWMRRATVVCVPSRRRKCGCGEAFGMVFAEAQAVGRPVVSYRQGGVVEAVEHGVTGILVDEGDVSALADALKRVIGDASMQLRFGEAGRQRVVGKFDLHRNAERVAELYQRMLVGHPRKVIGSVHG